MTEASFVNRPKLIFYIVSTFLFAKRLVARNPHLVKRSVFVLQALITIDTCISSGIITWSRSRTRKLSYPNKKKKILAVN